MLFEPLDPMPPDLRRFMPAPRHRSWMDNFRHFFFRGLAIVLPTVLSFWLLLMAYNFVDGRVAEPINRGVRQGILAFSAWPAPQPRDFVEAEQQLDSNHQAEWRSRRDALAATLGSDWTIERENTAFQEFLEPHARRHALRRWWDTYRIGSWSAMNLIGLVVAVGLIYFVGAVLGSFIGRRIYARGEELLQRVPLLGRVYPAIKQVTDFFMGGGGTTVRFNRVVAVQYPRKGLWSVGLVTGDPMKDLAGEPDDPLVTIFIPSSPTPFTGYVITVPKRDTIELGITIEEALRFTISGGVVLPASQRMIDEMTEESAAATEGRKAENHHDMPSSTGRPPDPTGHGREADEPRA
jgi:uncharacterized membrane protein